MPRPIAMSLRQQVVDRHRQQQSVATISQQLAMSSQSVRRLIAASKLAPDGLPKPNYRHCGPAGPTSAPKLLRAARWLRRLHPTWGVPFIHLMLKKRYPDQPLPAVRTLQTAFRRWGLNPTRAVLTHAAIGRATAPHNIWQVDAKERLRLLDGQVACYLSIIDEHSGAALAALVFPP